MGVKTFFKENGNKVLFWSGLMSGLVALGFVGWGTHKASKKLEEEGLTFSDIKSKPKEVMKSIYKCYIPAAAVTLISGTCLICSEKGNEKVQAGLVAAAKISETALFEFRDAIVSECGERTVKKVDDKIAMAPMENNPYEFVETKFYGPCKEQYVRFYIRPLNIAFYSTMEEVREGVIRADNELNYEGELSVNQLLVDYWNIDHSVNGMDNFGWRVSSRGSHICDSMRYTTIVGEDGKPQVIINFDFVLLR